MMRQPSYSALEALVTQWALLEAYPLANQEDVKALAWDIARHPAWWRAGGHFN